MSPDLQAPDALRGALAAQMTALYRAEVPAYARLVELVERVNRQVLAAAGDPRADDDALVAALSAQRHGAIRVGKAEELALLGRLFALYGMFPVDFYDLVPAGLPVFSTAFRPVDSDALAACPFRIFCSLLRTELIDDEAVREEAVASLDTRHICSPALEDMITHAELAGGVARADADTFVAETLRVFTWQGDARVDSDLYERLLQSHRLIADVVAFTGPHINHLTPRSLDIDAVHSGMAAAGLRGKAIVEGPPRRRCPILLRQTAFQAVAEPVRFHDRDGCHVTGSHTARFGEVEQRGAALTPAGRALYDECLAAALAASPTPASPGDAAVYDHALCAAFAGFPDDWLTLFERDLAYFRFRPVQAGAEALARHEPATREGLLAAIREGAVELEPITYEDFLPVSAAGIFRSNLGDTPAAHHDAPSSRQQFEACLGRHVIASDALYAAAQAESWRSLCSGSAGAA